jgi:hypothetical protein
MLTPASGERLYAPAPSAARRANLSTADEVRGLACWLDSLAARFFQRKGASRRASPCSVKILGRLSEYEAIKVSMEREQPCQMLACVEHPRLHGIPRKI